MPGRTLSWRVVGLLTAGAGAADDPDPTKRVAAEEEAKRREGDWEVVYYERDGAARPENIGKRISFGRGLVRFFDDQTEMNYRVDLRQEPGWRDGQPDPEPVGDSGNRAVGLRWAGSGFEGIYRREGDSMTLCYERRAFGGRQPTEFRTGSQTGEAYLGTLTTLRRVQPKAK